MWLIKCSRQSIGPERMYSRAKIFRCRRDGRSCSMAWPRWRSTGASSDYAEFLGVLEQQAKQTIFAPESRDAPVQILGPLEAAGLTFDALWFLGADDASWPAVGRPHPFLTRSLQRTHNMPHAETATANPVDVASGTDTNPALFADCARILLDDPGVDGLLISGLYGGYAIRFDDNLLEMEMRPATASRACRATTASPSWSIASTAPCRVICGPRR